MVRFSHCWDGPRTSLVEALLADLGAICPRITVENDVGDAGSMRERLVTALASGSPPDVVMVRSDAVAYFADQDALLPLDDLMANDGLAADWFLPSELASRRWQGRTYGLPEVTAGAQHLLFVNTSMLARIGVDPADAIETWQDLEALVAPAREADLLVLDPTRMPLGSTAHQVWTYANGGQYWDDDLGQIAWADEPGREAAEWLLRFVQAQAGSGQDGTTQGGSSQGGSSRGGSTQPTSGGSDARTALRTDEWGNGRTICSINTAGWFYDLHQQAQHLRYAAYDFPRNADNPLSAGATPSTGGWMLSIPRASRQQEAAWELVKLATASVSACAFTARQRRPSPRAGCDQSFGLAGSQPFWPAISASLRQTVPVPVAPIHPRLEQIYQDMQGDVLREHRPPRDVLDAAARDAQRLLDEWHATRTRS
jgi:ABC-type glycerol-3-phosphate transport system substrate-binding protein